MSTRYKISKTYLKEVLFFGGFLFGVVLFGINLYGETRDINYFVDYRPEKYLHEVDVLIKDSNMSREKVAYRVTDIVNNAIYHYWPDEDSKSFRVPWYENYLMFFANYLYPSVYKNYEFCDARLAIRRGAGLCSQAAIAVVDILEQKGIASRTVALNGHVISTIRIDDQTRWLLDPDYGVVIPHDLPEVEANPDIIKPYYKDKGYDDVTVEKIVSIITDTPNILEPRGVTGYPDCTKKKIFARKASYVAKWVIPVVLIIPFIVFKRKNGW